MRIMMEPTIPPSKRFRCPLNHAQVLQSRYLCQLAFDFFDHLFALAVQLVLRIEQAGPDAKGQGGGLGC